MNLLKSHARTAVAFFFLALLLTGLITIGGYGHAWDDLSEMNILRMALREYDALLPFDTSMGKTLESMGVMRLSESVERDHGICLYYPLFWAVCRDDFSVRQLSLIWRSHTWFVFTLGLWALYATARRMGLGRLLSCTAVLIMVLSPRFFAEGHYNNKDIPLLALTLVLMWQTARLMEKPDWKRGLSFAFAAGLCAGTRIIGAAFCALFGLMTVLHLWKSGRLNRRVIGTGMLTVLFSLLFYMLFTPAFLSDPLGYIEYLLKNAVSFSRWHGSILYFGEIISTAMIKPPRTYLPVFIAITTPLWALALLGVGCIMAISAGWKKRKNLLADPHSAVIMTAFSAWLLPLLGLIAVHALVYNGWRHVYFLYGPMVLCMVYGLDELCKRLFSRRFMRRVLACAVSACLLFSAAGIAANHPYQYAYYNALVPSENRYALFEPDWWNLSCTEAMRELLERNDGNVYVAASDRSTLTGISFASAYLNEDRLVIITGENAHLPPQYLAVNVGYGALSGFEPDENLTPVITISAYGSPITIVYRVEGSETP